MWDEFTALRYNNYNPTRKRHKLYYHNSNMITLIHI